MKYIILTISLILGATAVSAGSHGKDHEFPKKDCQEMFAGIGGLLEEADKEWAYLEKNPESSTCLLYTSPSPRDLSTSRMPSSA